MWSRAASSHALPEGSGARDSAMHDLHDALPPAEKKRVLAAAEERLRESEALNHDRTHEEQFAAAAATSTEIHRIKVFDGAQCDSIVDALRAAAEKRGGWDTDRHAKYPTVDLPLSAAGGDVERLVRATIFDKILRPLACRYFGKGMLPEHLCYHDLFFVRYCHSPEQSTHKQHQTSLPVHTDGSVFSFNVLLSERSAFDGGGTYFEHDGSIVQPDARGGGIAHGGQVRHGGHPITRGERLLLVGFVGAEPIGKSYSAKLARWAAYHAWCKFGEAAWQRDDGGKEAAAAPELEPIEDPQEEEPAHLEAAATEEEEEPAHLRDDVLHPLLEEVGACGDLHRAAAVCKRWAATAAQLWPVVVGRWNATLQHDLRCITYKRTEDYLSRSVDMWQHRIVHDKSQSSLLVGENLPGVPNPLNQQPLQRDPVQVVAAADGVYADWAVLEKAEDTLPSSSSNTYYRLPYQGRDYQLVPHRRPISVIWTGSGAELTWAADAATTTADAATTRTVQYAAIRLKDYMQIGC